MKEKANNPGEAGLTINQPADNEPADKGPHNEQPFIIRGLPEPKVQFTAHSDYLIDREADNETDT